MSEFIKPQPNVGMMAWIREQNELTLYISAISLGEIQEGITALHQSAKRAALQAWLDNDLRKRFTGRVLMVDDEVGLAWGQIRAEAAKRGKTLSKLDALIAATALTQKATLVTRNVSDFKAVTGLNLMNPWS
jgi:toxin FitB